MPCEHQLRFLEANPRRLHAGGRPAMEKQKQKGPGGDASESLPGAEQGVSVLSRKQHCPTLPSLL